ncbi:MAG: ATP-binding protein [Gallionella sp.]
MKRSLQSQLSLLLGGAVILMGVIATIASFYLAYAEAKELQDDMLKQIAAQSLSSGISQNLNDSDLNDPESRIYILHLPRDVQPAWLGRSLTTGLHSINAGNLHWRVFVNDQKDSRTVVYQSTEANDEIAFNSALRTLLLLLVLLPILVGLIAFIVRQQLRPISALAQQLDAQASEHFEPLNATGIAQEITPFIHAINRLFARVAELLTQQRRFIADAAHELRSPLTALSLQAQNLSAADSLASLQQRIVPLQTGIERTRQLSEQLLTLARTQAAINEPHEIAVATLARQLIAEYLPFAEAKNIDLGLAESNALTLHGTPENLHLILKNGLENALKYTPKNGRITVLLRTENDDAIIEVIDNGTGIPAAQRERVFDAFYRLSDATGIGSGLGLTIAQQAAQNLGGIISLHDNQLTSGLVFRYRQSAL